MFTKSLSKITEFSPLKMNNIERRSRLILAKCKSTFDAIHKRKFVIPNTSLHSITDKVCHYKMQNFGTYSALPKNEK